MSANQKPQASEAAFLNKMRGSTEGSPEDKVCNKTSLENQRSTEELQEEQSESKLGTLKNQQIFQNDNDMDDLEASKNSKKDGRSLSSTPHDIHTPTGSYSDGESSDCDEEDIHAPQSKILLGVGCFLTILILGACAAGLLVTFMKDADTLTTSGSDVAQTPNLAPIPSMAPVSSTSAPVNGWLQQGVDILGEVGSYSAWSVDLSQDGTTVAVGAWADEATGSTAGNTRVYRYESATWNQLGSEIEGENAGDYSGWSISLSGNGNIVAIGGHGSDGNIGNTEDSGYVRVFQWTGSKWSKLGKSIYGEARYDLSGWSVSLSSDGLTLAVGSPGHHINSAAVGQVRVFQYNDTDWSQVGQDVEGQAADDEFGHSVSLNADGSYLAVGVPGSDSVGSRSGEVQVLKLKDNQWVAMGSPLVGFAAGDEFGHSVSLTGNAGEPNTLAIGSPGSDSAGLNAGATSIFVWIGIAWLQLGDSIRGVAPGDKSGSSVSLSADSFTVAIGAPGNRDGTGRTEMRRWDQTTWHQIGEIRGSKAGDSSGRAVSIAGDGMQVTVGAAADSGNMGFTRVYEFKGISFLLD